MVGGTAALCWVWGLASPCCAAQCMCLAPLSAPTLAPSTARPVAHPNAGIPPEAMPLQRHASYPARAGGRTAKGSKKRKVSERAQALLPVEESEA